MKNTSKTKKKEEECVVCNALLKVCKRLKGKKGEKYCKHKLRQLEDDKITPDEFDDKIYSHFGDERLDREFGKEIKNASK